MNREPGDQRDDSERAVFIDPNRGKERKRAMTVAASATVTIVSLASLQFSDVSAPWSYALMCGIFAGSSAMLWNAHAAISGDGADEFPEIVVDCEDIRLGGSPSGDGELISWLRIRSVDRDESALILRFDPEDLASNDPKKRISVIRIAMDEQRRAGLPAAIERFRPSAASQA